MLDEATKAEIPGWVERKLAQWGEFAPEVVDGKLQGLPLQISQTSPLKSTFILRWSSPDFEEAVIIGQLPHIHRVPKNPKRPALKPTDFREATNEEKPRHKRRIDLSNDEIDQILGAWSKGQSALSLPFVLSVWRRDGQEYVR